MKHLRVLFLVLSLASFLSSNAQEFPWKKYGFDLKVVSLSKGKYQEFHDLTDIVEIGSVLYNTQTKKIVGFIKKDTLYNETFSKPHIISRWISPDPLSEEYSSWSPYNYVMNNPIILTDPDGREPVKQFAGTSTGFINFINSKNSKFGTFTGNQAHNKLLAFGKTKMTWSGPKPAITAPLNTSGGNRYIYTKKGGWVDMAHFMFYAGRAYQYKQDGSKNPIGEAVQDGYKQEYLDQFGATYSAYSYEDLPSDKFGAEFAVEFFDSNSDLTFGEQLMNYLDNELGATNPEDAPNYENLPDKHPTEGKPSTQNKTTDPLFTKDEEKY